MRGIIKSLLDNDLYAFTMRKAILDHYPGTWVRYQFTNRNPGVDFLYATLIDDLHHEAEQMAMLRLSSAEHAWLQAECPYLGCSYIDGLFLFAYQPPQLSVGLRDVEGGLTQLTLSMEGPWEDIVLWSTPLLAILTELTCRRADSGRPLSSGWSTTNSIAAKAEALSRAGVHWTDFGTRRRRSFEVQDAVVRIMSEFPGFQGTCNPHLAMKYGVKAQGTMAHEWIMGVSVLEGLRHANRHALNRWSESFHGDLGIALTDTYGTDAFWVDFDPYLAKLFDGIRQDSHDPVSFGNRAIDEYTKRKIRPASKTVVFSDSLTVEKSIGLKAQFQGRFRPLMGIGTHLTNDIDGRPAPNIVIKMVECAGVQTVKLGDGSGKATGDRDARRVALHTFFGTPLDTPNPGGVQ